MATAGADMARAVLYFPQGQPFSVGLRFLVGVLLLGSMLGLGCASCQDNNQGCRETPLPVAQTMCLLYGTCHSGKESLSCLVMSIPKASLLPTAVLHWQGSSIPRRVSHPLSLRMR